MTTDPFTALWGHLYHIIIAVNQSLLVDRYKLFRLQVNAAAALLFQLREWFSLTLGYIESGCGRSFENNSLLFWLHSHLTLLLDLSFI